MRDGGGIRFGSGYLGRELGNGPGQPPADQPAANKANGQRDQHDEGEQLLQPLGESKELHRGNGAHEKPVLARERGVPAVEVQGGISACLCRGVRVSGRVCQDGRAFCEDEWSGRKSAYCTGGCS